MPNDRKATVARTGRPPITERRKAETRLEVARAAVRLFLTKGVAGTSAEEIAEAAGISSRTLWRYFPTKDSCVTPLLTGVIELTVHCMRSWRSDQDMVDLLDSALVDTARLAAKALADRETLLDLVRLTRTEPGLRAVWLEVHKDAEPAFAEALAHRAGQPGPDLAVTVQAAMINTALRVAMEHYAFTTDRADAEKQDFDAAIREALMIAARSLSP